MFRRNLPRFTFGLILGLAAAACAGHRVAALGADGATVTDRLSPRDALATFQLPAGFQIELVAAEPDLFNPMTMTLDEAGHIFVSLAHTYRYGAEGSPVPQPTNPIVRLELAADGRVAQRVGVVAGFADPVMGMAVRGGYLWYTNLNELCRVELDQQGRAGAPQVLVRDATKPWNPFGMYRLNFGPDGWLYLNVGDHPTDLTGPTNQVAVRGNTGGVFRLQPDGSQLQLLVQGMRAPFSLDIDPFGRLWVLSNGEGNPNRLIEAIPGADYHFQTRRVDWAWLAGKHPHAPPVWEHAPGAHTAVVAYASSAFPAEYWGNLLISNWGVHGFPSANHVIVRHQLDERGRLLHSEPFLTTTDPHFRPTQITLAPDGGLYVLDWYGRDDENDLTGRLYKISYRPPSTDPAVAAAGLGSRNHWIRRALARELAAAGPAASDDLRRFATGADPLAAAEALWVLRQAVWPKAADAMQAATEHPDWRVRRLAVQLLRDRGVAPRRLDQLVEDEDVAVAMEAALCLAEPAARVRQLIGILQRGAADDVRLRYWAALEIARQGTADDFETLLASDSETVRLTGLIVLDAALHDGTRAAEARRVLARHLAQPGQVELLEWLALAERWPAADLAAPLAEQLTGAAANQMSAVQFVRGAKLFQQLAASNDPARANLLDAAIDRFVDRVTAQQVQLATRSEKLDVLELALAGGFDAAAMQVIDRLARDDDAVVREAVHQRLATDGANQPRCREFCWELATDAAASVDARGDAIVTLARIEEQGGSDGWRELLAAPTDAIVLLTLRMLRVHRDQAAAARTVAAARPLLAERGAKISAELAFHQQFLAQGPLDPLSVTPAAGRRVDPAVTARKAALKQRLLAAYPQGDAALGRQVVRAQVCQRCHQAAGGDTSLGPNLDGVAATNQVEYLIDSILFPSQIIKTGYQFEIVITGGGQILFGRVLEAGNKLTVVSPLGERTTVSVKEVEQRQQLPVSIMPDSLDSIMSEPELADLVAYLASLRTAPGANP